MCQIGIFWFSKNLDSLIDYKRGEKYWLPSKAFRNECTGQDFLIAENFNLSLKLSTVKPAKRKFQRKFPINYI